MLRRIALRDFVIVPTLDLELAAGFSVLTGETGAGKSILVDALQLALGSRGDAAVVREGATRADIAAEFDTPATLLPWLEEAGFDPAGSLLLRRSIDTLGKSRAWINGSPATLAQLREAAEQLVDIHGQHAWQSLTRPATARELLDSHAGIDTAALAAAFVRRKASAQALTQARAQGDRLASERERLLWQIAELDRLGLDQHEWAQISAEHDRLAHAQALIDGVRLAIDALDDAEPNAQALAARAADALARVAGHDQRLTPVIEVLGSALAQLQDAGHSLNAYLAQAELDPARLAELDSQLAAWVSLARRFRRPPAELPALLAEWRQALAELDAASDLGALQAAAERDEALYQSAAMHTGAQRRAAAPGLASAVTRAMQGLGMAGGRFEIALSPATQPQAQGLESVEFLVAGHAGSTPRPLAKVASGGELSRLALAIAVTALQGGGPADPAGSAGTLIFDEIDVGIGGAVGDTVGAMLKQLGRQRQVLAVTHLAQVAACADQHVLVSKTQQNGRAASLVTPVTGQSRVTEVARMLGGERMADTSLAHAQAMLHDAALRGASPMR